MKRHSRIGMNMQFGVPYLRAITDMLDFFLILEYYLVTLDLESLPNTSATTYAKFFNQNQMGIIMQAVG